MSDQECKVRPVIMNVINNEPLFYSYSVLVNKCSGSCNDINNTYTNLCVPDVVNPIQDWLFGGCSRMGGEKALSP